MANFPGSEQKEDQYYLGGQILAATANGIGGEIDPATADGWADTMARLAIADDLAEEHPDLFERPELLLENLGLNPDNPELGRTAAALLAAALSSDQATTLNEHFGFRHEEALRSLDLLRYQSPEAIRANLPVWQQLGVVSVAGIYLDSFIDARKDSARLDQFTAPRLALGALRRFGRAARLIEPATGRALLKASHEVGLDRHALHSVVRVFRKPVDRGAVQRNVAETIKSPA